MSAKKILLGKCVICGKDLWSTDRTSFVEIPNIGPACMCHKGVEELIKEIVKENKENY